MRKEGATVIGVATTGPSTDGAAERINVTLRAETRRRLNQARYKQAVQINVSAVCDAAITAELDRLDRPGASPARSGPNPDVSELAARVRTWLERVEEDCFYGRDIPLVATNRFDWRTAGASLAMLARDGRLVVIPPDNGPGTFRSAR